MMDYIVTRDTAKEVARVLSDAGYSAVARTRKGGPIGVQLLRENTFLAVGTKINVSPGNLVIKEVQSEQAAEAEAGNQEGS